MRGFILGFDWKRFFLGLYKKALNTDIFSRAAQVAFYFSFSLFPLLFFLISLLGIVLGTTAGLKGELYGYVRQIMPPSAFELVTRTVDEIVNSSTGGKLTIGLLITLWSASAGIGSIRNALNAVYELQETRWWWKTKLQSLAVTLLLILLVAVVLGIVFYGWQLTGSVLTYISGPDPSPWILTSIQWASFLLTMLFACEVIYNWLPNFRRFRWDWITPGSVVAIVLWLLLTRGFRLYLEYFNTYNKAYGSLGAVIILMLWLYLTAIVIMVGGAINAVIDEMKAEATKEALEKEEIESTKIENA